MTLARLGQRVTQRRPIAGRASEQVDQSRLGRLTGQAFCQRLLARPIPGGQLHGRIMGQPIGVVLGRVALGQGIQPFAQQFDQLIANQILPTRIGESSGQPLGQPEAMIGLAQQDQACIGRDPLVGLADLDGAVESRLK
jgi:hypothetical protein